MPTKNKQTKNEMLRFFASECTLLDYLDFVLNQGSQCSKLWKIEKTILCHFEGNILVLIENTTSLLYWMRKFWWGFNRHGWC